MNVLEARHQFFHGIATDEGIVCPCCDRRGQVDCYPPRQRLTQLVGLLVEQGFCRGSYNDFPRVKDKNDGLVKVTNYNMLRHFGLLKPVGKGDWALTTNAIPFVEGRHKVTITAYIFNAKKLGESPTKVSYIEALQGVKKDTDRPVPDYPYAGGTMDLSFARAVHQAARIVGIHCVVCSRYNKVYLRGVACHTAEWLQRLYDAPYGWHNAYSQELDAQTGEYIYLLCWDLVEQSGITWRITPKGRQFVRGELTIDESVVTLNDKVIGFHGPQVDFKTCLNRTPRTGD